MAIAYLACRPVSSRIALFFVLAVLPATRPARAAPHLLGYKEAPSGRFTLFESGQVRPLALSPSGNFLFAANTPDNRLEVFRVKSHGLEHRASIPVGLEPVAVAARNDNEVWVVNHLSDSVSVVNLTAGGTAGRVVRTLLVGDEPRDIVFAGAAKNRAFITTAHRGQNVPYDPQLSTPGVGRADVWVFNADRLGGTLNGTPLTIVTLFSDTPRALAVSPDGSRVYAAAFHSGNRTSTINETAIPDGFGPNGVPGPSTNAAGRPAPEVGVIVKFNGTHWVDSLGRVRDDQVRFSLPDKDVFVLNAIANPPVPIAGAAGFYRGVGTILYNMVVNPVNGKVYVSNTEAGNDKRFEGPGEFAGQSLRGHLHESRITVLGPAGSVAPRHLNKHIDYAHCCEAIPNAENDKSLAFPQQMAVTRDGRTLYVATLGTSKIGIFDTRDLERDTFTPNAADQIKVSRPDALAWRPHGWQRRAERPAEQRRFRRARGVRPVQPSFHQPARPPHGPLAGGDGCLHRLHPPGDVSAEPESAAEQPAQRQPERRPEALRQHQLRDSVGSGAQWRRPHLQRLPCDQPERQLGLGGARVLRHVESL